MDEASGQPTPEPESPFAAAGPPVPPAGELKVEPVSFSGTGDEYFRIWIVNLALTIVTLGVYSAWAKVRRMQFFYRHMRVAGAGFDYHGNPIAILKGRIVGLILFGLYSVAGYLNIWVAVTIFCALAAIMPWLIGRSLRFRLHNSSYRGIRFKFHGTTGQAYWLFLALPLLTVLSLFTLGPFWHHRIKRYQFTNAAYGRSRFSFAASVGDFYVTYVLAMFVFVVLFAVLFAGVMGLAVGAAVAGGGVPEGGPPELGAAGVAMMIAFGLIYVTAIVTTQAITTTRIQNDCWNNIKLAGHGFISEMKVGSLFWILLTNLLATVATIGFFRPYAQVRLARYYASTLTLVTAAGFADFLAAEAQEESAIGEETAELFDFDIAF